MDDDYENWRAAAVAMSTRPGECVLCYVHRMISAFGCDGTLRWALRWRDRRAPRATRLEARLTARGALCDCELFTDRESALRAPERCAGSDGASAPCDNWGSFGRASW
ncbi:DUF2695 domain-containing protein [Petropleomorpha daqingensis]|uniref:DUF2695 domain-containing protein n=1 Tax=Petropleomorpha daqingensis TaxID=2026353 RepID=A0A853CIU6_9ACTN|nr:hypothetical protein [Petropleomorpha daqingensis]